MRFLIITLFMLLAIEGCTSLDPKPTGSTGSLVTVVATAMNDPNAGTEWLPTGLLSVSFSAVRGSIFGSPTEEDLVRIPVLIGKDIALNFTELEARIEPLAEPPSNPTFDGVAFDPPATRIARVGTFFFSETNLRYAAGAGFKDAATNDHLLLVYFDRSCSVRGTMGVQEQSAEINISVPAAGLWWLRVTQIDENRSKLTLLSGIENIVLVARKPRM